MDKKIKEYLKKYDAMFDELLDLQEKRNNAKYYNDGNLDATQKLVDEKKKEIELYTDEFAKYIFDLYSPKNPKLVDRYSKEKLRFVDAFGDDYSKVTKAKKESLIGLVCNDGRYKM